MELRISHVALGSGADGATERFYREVVGLVPVASGSDDAVLRLGHGSGHHVLELRPGSGLHHFGLEVRGLGLDRLGDRLEAAGAEAERRDGALWTRDPDGNLIELHGPIDRDGERTTDGGLRPQRTDHITFASARVAEMVAFYVELLGLRISDRMLDEFVWMRGGRHHHDVAVVRADAAGLDHYSYEIGSWANVLAWCDRLAAHDIPLSWGPGRHGPGHNLFVFVADPDGRQVELSCDMEQFADELVDYGPVPRTWARRPEVANRWGPLPPTRVALTTDGAVTPVGAGS